jgi:hypothetical protein
MGAPWFSANSGGRNVDAESRPTRRPPIAGQIASALATSHRKPSRAPLG